jgi:hypothetical protein
MPDNETNHDGELCYKEIPFRLDYPCDNVSSVV